MDLTTTNNIVFAGGTEYGFLAGAQATVNFAMGSFGGATFTLFQSDGRLAVDARVAVDTDKVAAARTVITSYSIHYTKLYEAVREKAPPR